MRERSMEMVRLSSRGVVMDQTAEGMAGKRQFLGTFVVHFKQINLGFRER